MELQRINNLWKFLALKNNLPLTVSAEADIKYVIKKGGLELTHCFNQKFLKQSSLKLKEGTFNENQIAHFFNDQKLRFGFDHASFNPPHSRIFFPKDLLQLKTKYDLKVQKDRNGHFEITIQPFSPKNIYDILNATNLISRTLWKKNYFAEGIRN
jgi:hypothetical protein